MKTTHVDNAEDGQGKATQSSVPEHALLLAINANTSALLAIHSQLERIGDFLEEG